jgi:glycosidase
VEIVQVYPDRTTKALPGEPLLFVVSVKDAPADLRIEVWTDVVCKEFSPTSNAEFAVPLQRKRLSGDVTRFERAITPTRCGFYSFCVRHLQGKRWSWSGGRDYESRRTIALNIEPPWVTSAVVYNAFVRQFGARDRNKDGIIEPGEGGTFNDLIERMPHFRKLGIGAIYLNPIQMTGEVFQYKEELMPHYQDETNHLPLHMHPGSVYTVKDYKSIDPELGFNEHDPDTDQYGEFRRFVAVCHENGIRVILDIVFGHTARDSLIQRIHPEWFVYKRNPQSLDEPYVYYESPEAEAYWGKPDFAFSPYDHDIFWTDCTRLNWNWKPVPGPNPQPRNPRIKEMREYFKSVLRYWIKQYGVDGFRLDVAYSVPPDFWHEALADCRATAREVCLLHEEHPQKQAVAPLSPEILFVGETYVDDVNELQECGITLLNGDFSSKIFTVEQLKGYLDYAYNISGDFFPRNSRWMLFPECHDFARLPEKFSSQLLHDSSDVQLNKSRWVLAATLPGTPMLHNGYEVVEHKSVSVRTYTGINWGSAKNITEYIGKVNTARNNHVALQKGDYTFVESEQGATSNAQLYAFLRDYTDHDGKRDTIIVVVNMDFNNKADGVRIDLPSLNGYDWERPFVLHDLLTGSTYERKEHEVIVVLEPGESHVFEVKQK